MAVDVNKKIIRTLKANIDAGAHLKSLEQKWHKGFINKEEYDYLVDYYYKKWGRN